ncbi:phenylalanine--tRNA ligase subunit alpha [Leptospirillum ferriphilum]|jgi:phenylalanyl-tRNA synthetase alpha chain|uniref:phenylalanine--tRNA ligase n=2 Tax=Leptospirillum TaxID=179 RepID=A0A094WBF2_9BACT|nr:phenylalanine--tRNA ligase subunit alpha [Leptospirillum ferriphilum]EDZ39739.1 MAG: Phenylalanyl-tRNA synthetase alpha chain [Leptospirillum sp. Group II '5-way CG']KGA94878.1 Phenylalanyl-tRNA synthetase alpha chain [Leptospirillum ferriphilum]
MSWNFHPLEITVLKALFKRPEGEREDLLQEEIRMDPGQFQMAAGWLKAKNLIEETILETRTEISLTEIGQQVLKDGFPEEWILKKLKDDPSLTLDNLRKSVKDPAQISKAIGDLKEMGVLSILPGGHLKQAAPLPPVLERTYAIIRSLEDKSPLTFEDLSEEDRELLGSFQRKRGKGKGVLRFDVREVRHLSLRKGVLSPDDLDVREDLLGPVTPEMIHNRSWKGGAFRPYSLETPPPRPMIGQSHPYREYLEEVRRQLVRLGFEEMTGPIVESEFWNMDTLFIPQTHPARDIHDIYFVRDPREVASLDKDILPRVRAVHAGEGETFGSRGWRQPFNEKQARRLLLRSQGTALSARKLASGPEIPGKYFALARCFRYEQVDQTHAVDFYQAEGIVVEEGASFRTLLGLLTLFAREVAGAREVHFKPAYFPFTEPSVEVHVKHPQLGWMELGGAGLFRPEVLRPLGVKTPVIAWGLGIDRMAMMRLGLSDIRDLFSGSLHTLQSMILSRAKNRQTNKQPL